MEILQKSYNGFVQNINFAHKSTAIDILLSIIVKKDP